MSDLLAELRACGLAIGMREHLQVGRLLERWTDHDLAALRTSLAALLATDPGEVRLVQEAFDRLYPAVPPPPPDPLPDAQTPPPRRRLWPLVGAYGPGLMLAAVLAVAVVTLKTRDTPPAQGPEPPEPTVTEDEDPQKEPPSPPAIEWPQLPPLPNRIRAAAAGSGLALAAFLALYTRRITRQSQRRGTRQLAAEADTLTGPQTYRLRLPGLAPPFRRELLDDLATLLGRRATTAVARREIDVDRSLEHTLEAGLAPRIVFRRRSSAEPLLVLEDVGPGMRYHRRRVRALLSGLAARGIAFERWRFDGHGARLFQRSDAPPVTLERLARQRSHSPLLILSTGEGLREGDDLRPAAWVEKLRAWAPRAWLHPASDPTTWRSALRQVPMPVWPMRPEGLLAASRYLAGGEADPGSPSRAPRALAPLDVDRLRALLALAPRHDPELLERLRQRFCPWVPASAVAEALEAPPLHEPLPFGPADAEVHAFLATLLDASEPLEGSAAHERWRLDLALQAVHLPERASEGLAELATLANGPLAVEVEVAVEPLAIGKEQIPVDTRRALRRRVLGGVKRNARRRAVAEPGSHPWRYAVPRLPEFVPPLLLLIATVLATPYLGSAFNTELRPTEHLFDLSVVDPQGTGAFSLKAEARDPFQGEVEVIQGENVVHSTFRYGDQEDIDLFLPEEDRGYWYWARADLPNGVTGVSGLVWVPEARTVETQSIPGSEETDPAQAQLDLELDQLQSALGRIAETRRTALGVVVTLASDQLDFGFDRTELNSQNRDFLNRIAGVLLTFEGYSIQVYGHTDAGGSTDFNQKLSEQRADAVRNHLVEVGIPPGVISTRGLGGTSPLVAGTDLVSRQRNRRIELAIVFSEREGIPETPDPARTLEESELREQLVRELDRMQEALGRIAETRRTALGLVFGTSPIEFDSGSSELKDEHREMLSRLAGAVLTFEHYGIQLFGHIDDTEPQGLAESRASVVRNYLVEAGVPAENITSMGLGRDSPLVEGTDPEALQRNRRVDFAFVSSD